jgi:hypothetical protein
MTNQVARAVRVEEMDQDLIMAGMELLIIVSQDDGEGADQEAINAAMARFRQVANGE